MRGELPPVGQVSAVALLGVLLAGGALTPTLTSLHAELTREWRAAAPHATLRDCAATVDANVRSGPGMDAPPVFQVAGGEGMVCGRRSGSWLHVDVPGRGEGWIYARLVDEVP